MPSAIPPSVADLETAEEDASYTAWLRAKVATSLADPRPAIPHDEVERRMVERFAKLHAQQHQA